MVQPTQHDIAPELTPEAWKALPVHERALRRAAYWTDVRKVEEQPRGSNKGPEVSYFLEAAGAHPGDPWCVSFVAANFKDSGGTELPPNPASTHSWYEWAHQTGRLVTTPRRGDVFIIIESPTTGHGGHVIEMTGNSYRTLEGNTNDGQSREGYGCFRHTRTANASTHFIRMS
ncbi:hypothetical protein [Fimbriimonas ginsengisoli]|uniref:CHAP domain containing protein n=1 Tax=Fimbriimonas ginsengisoli Gsoil 348 TaxID=661478 RepID=A0A068NLS5_FIMGI|nr:hypothetical protein [Fimbriimonas ginsengisoli]AIE84426.1 CHAP domain containing protein [Fimbriimonas ginsengisoli Gsoil 348]